MGKRYNQDIIPKMDYIVCTKNDVDMIEECVRGIYNQNNIDRVILVVSDKSNDGTVNKVKFLQRSGLVDIVSFENQSVTYAKKYGALIARTDFIVYVDSDVILKRNWIQQMWKYMCDDVDAITGIVISNMKMFRYQLKYERTKEIKNRGMYADTVIRKEVVDSWKAPIELDAWGDYSLTQHILQRGRKWLSVPVFIRHAYRYEPAYFRGSIIGTASARRAGFYKSRFAFIKSLLRMLFGSVRVAVQEREVYFLWSGLERFVGSIIGYFAWNKYLRLRR